MEDQTTALQSELYNMNELCQQKDHALQQNTVQVEAAQMVMDAEIQALTLKMEEELEKSVCCSMAQTVVTQSTGLATPVECCPLFYQVSGVRRCQHLKLFRRS
ncbi:hypothetical protein SKAU_G00392730 [Synaphobranchus kaupii]|uniref:Uncharacterized protein n=1 Tax=Synaphobranchus kaupii TaxID=118154 RepID=A0A9Q1EBY9_SYNKA|nr:hypothetical protein SKAU_G00392730 [Synaphobranchus kaupii]